MYSHPLRVRLRVHEVKDARGDEEASAFARPLIPIKAAGLDGDTLNLHRKINLPAESLIDPETREMIVASMRTLVEDDEQS